MSTAQASASHVPAVRLSRTFEAPPERLWQAWTEPQALMQWLGPRGISVVEADLDLRAGGAYRIVMRNSDGDRIHVFGNYVEVAAPEKLAFTLTFRWEEGGTTREEAPDSLVTVALRGQEEATELVLTHERIPDDHTRSRLTFGWGSTVDELAAWVSERDEGTA